MGFYDEMRGVATDLLTEFQQGSITLTRTVPGEPDPETPWIPGEPTATTYTLKATVKGVSDEYVDGTTILSTDLEMMCAIFEIDPLPSDAMSIDGKAVTILRVMPIPAAGTAAAWKLIVRG